MVLIFLIKHNPGGGGDARFFNEFGRQVYTLTAKLIIRFPNSNAFFVLYIYI